VLINISVLLGASMKLDGFVKLLLSR
jgi:hypothetical protein